MSKYKNKKVVVDGYNFDSKAEARYYEHTYYNSPLSAYNNALNKDFMNEEVELILPKVKEIQITIAPIDDLLELKIDLAKSGYEVKSIRKVCSYEND